MPKPDFSSKPGGMSRVYNTSNADPRRAPDLAPRPTFGLWDAIFVLDQPDTRTSLSEADEVIFGVGLPQPICFLFKQIGSTETNVSVLPCFPQKDNADLEKYNSTGTTMPIRSSKHYTR